MKALLFIVLLRLTSVSYANVVDQRFYNDYDQVYREYTQISLDTGTYTAQLDSGCLTANGTGCHLVNCHCLSVSVIQSPPSTYRGCAMLVTYYNSHREAMREILQNTTPLLEGDTGNNVPLVRLRAELERSIIDSHNVEEFCKEINAELRLRRSVWQSFVETSQKLCYQLVDKVSSLFF